jgi:diadenosine tetraphosphatase ApaH/serine/threonine PP2A family protein phosphatase
VTTVGLLADVHANLAALEAVLAALGRVDAIWVMGDTVGYGPDPSDVLAVLRSRGAVMVAGNHDRAVATGEGVDLFNPYAAAAVRLHRSWLSAEERDSLAALPLTVQADGFTLCHGSLRDPIWEYVMTPPQAMATMRLAKTPRCCNGHTHIPAVFVASDGTAQRRDPTPETPIRLDGRALVNPGSVGQPRDDDPRAAYAVLDIEDGTVTFRRASYDVAATQAKIRARGLPGILADRLAIGF